MSEIPSFLRKTSGVTSAPKLKDARPIRCGSFALEASGHPWAFELLHDQPDHFLLWVTRGQGRVNINGVLRGISMNTALFLPAGTVFSIELPNNAQALFLQCPPDIAHRMPSEMLSLHIRDGLAQAELTGLIDSMGRERSLARPFHSDALQAYASLVAVWLRRQAEIVTNEKPRNGAAQRLVKRYFQMLRRDYDKPLAMADFAHRLDVTPTPLTRVCKQVSGKTASEVLTERRLHAALSALSKKQPSVKTIAEDLGFGSAAYFTRFIQNQIGCSPTEFRKASSNAPKRV